MFWLNLPKKGISSVKQKQKQKQKKKHFSVRPWLLPTILNFSAWRPTETTTFLCLFFF